MTWCATPASTSSSPRSTTPRTSGTASSQSTSAAPSPRWGAGPTVDEIAAPYVFLASPAAAYVTGAVLPVDGGYTAT
ncbi:MULTISPECIES: SDR family oxidoreductase [unclassified Kribbella]|uniref:SDR family oxidoreductase n=1 Tax=unclassified Kribbella TaxID=2644121 RepID=UPI0033E4CA02